MTCAHHWLLDSPSGGPTCWGECKKCGIRSNHHRTSTDDYTFVPENKYKNSTTAGQFTSEGGKKANQKSRAWRETL